METQTLKVGTRVIREVFLDDGTWHREGDSCLKRSPIRLGTIEKIYDEYYDVCWDDIGLRKRYLAHGIKFFRE